MVESAVAFRIHSPNSLWLEVCVDGQAHGPMRFLHLLPELAPRKPNLFCYVPAAGSWHHTRAQVTHWDVLCCVVVSSVWCLRGGTIFWKPIHRSLSFASNSCTATQFLLFCEDDEVLHTHFPEASPCLLLTWALQWRCSEEVICWLSPTEQYQIW